MARKQKATVIRLIQADSNPSITSMVMPAWLMPGDFF